MYPTQTSLIPVAVALARFLGERGLSAFTSNYPYWYLGTTPFNFLTGPIIPGITVLFNTLISGTSYFDILIYLIIISCLASAIGWALLVSKIKGEKLTFAPFVIYFLIFSILPFKYLNGLALAEPAAFIAEMLIPYVFLICRKNSYWGALIVAILLLISTKVLPILTIGMIILSLTGSRIDGKLKNWKKPLKKTLLILLIGLVLATFYYTPAFWLTILTNPSVGGASGAKMIVSLLGLARSFIPIVLALVVVYFSKKISSKISFFGWMWILVFGFLTLWRAASDLDFWIDWIIWLGEIEIGIGIMIAANYKKIGRILLLVFPFLASYLVFRAMGSPILISKSLPLEAKSIEKLSEIAGNDLVYVTGMSTFWLNSLYDMPQIRGGRDEVSINPDWMRASYVFREGNNPDEIINDLKKLNIHYILVNTRFSQDFYHDFKNLTLWSSLGKVKWVGNGDIIYSQ